MADIRTLNNVKTVLQDVATRHYQINSFGWGVQAEIGAETDYNYPLLWATPISATLVESEGNNNYPIFEMNIELKSLDLVHKDETNETDVESDTLQTLRDIVNEFKNHPYYNRSRMDIVGDVDFTALDEFSDDETSGWNTTLTIRLRNDSSFCGLPMEDISGFSFTGPELTAITYQTQYITCDTLTACTSFQSYVDRYLPLSGGTMTGDVYFKNARSVSEVITGGTITTGHTIDFSVSNVFDYTISGNTTLTFSNEVEGQTSVIAVSQDSTGSHTLTWPSAVQWAGGTEPTMSTATGATDVYTITRINGNTYGSYIQNFS